MHLGRNTLLLATLDLAESLGLPRSAIHHEIGLDQRAAETPGAYVPAAAIIEAMEFAAVRTQRRDFGLMIADRRDHLNLGLFGLLLEQCSSVAEMHSYAKRFLHLHNTALDYDLIRERSRGVARLQIGARPHYEPRHYVEALLAMYVRMVTMVLGPRWRPTAVHFKHEQLAGSDAYARRFGPDIKFKQRFNGVVYRLSDLDRRAGKRSTMHKLRIENLLRESDAAGEIETTAEVARLARMLMPQGVTLERVAGVLKTSPRSLQRKLSLDCTNFTSIVAETREDMARDYLTKHKMSVGDIAPLLGYSEPSAVSRFLRARTRQTARSIKRHGRRRAAKGGKDL